MPGILLSDNEKSLQQLLSNKWKLLCTRKKECKIIHGRSHYSQFQGIVKRCNQDVENVLRTIWMIDK